MLVALVNVLKATELHTSKGDSMVCELHLSVKGGSPWADRWQLHS